MHEIVRRLADDGAAVMLISSDLTEVMENSDRVVVFRQGRIAGQYNKIHPTENEIKEGTHPGDTELRVFETDFGTIGIQICFDVNWQEQWRRLKDDPSLIPNAVDELLRYDSSVQMTGRVTNTEVEVGGVTLAAGESVLMLLGAANRDPAQYADPDRLDVGRQNIRPMSFGGGIHHCLGAQLARLEAELVFAALIERMPNLTLPEKDTPAWRRSFTLRGLRRLPAVWH